jgi:hypothetical protein
MNVAERQDHGPDSAELPVQVLRSFDGQRVAMGVVDLGAE